MRKYKILIADDDKAFRVALRMRLTDWGYSVLESPDGLGVIGQHVRECVDVIILDHEMPNGDGQSVARLLRNETDVPIVFLSGHQHRRFESTIAVLSDVYYLSKPIDHDALRLLLRRILSTPTQSLVECTIPA